MLFGKHQITVAEQNRRRNMFLYATASMEMEGANYKNAPDNVHYEAWVNGDLNSEELKVKLRETRDALRVR